MNTELVIETIVATVVGGLLLVAILWAWGNRTALRRWLADQVAVAKDSEQEAAAERVRVLRAQVLEVARASRETLPAHSTGRNPTVVTFSDGGTSWFYSDWSSYKRDMASGAVKPTRTFSQEPPLPVARWDHARLEKWLSDHAV